MVQNVRSASQTQAACVSSSVVASLLTTCGDGNLPVFRIVLNTSFVQPATEKALRAVRLPSLPETAQAICRAGLPYQAFCHTHRRPFAGKRHFSSPSRMTTYLTSTAIFAASQPPVIMYSILLFSNEINTAIKTDANVFVYTAPS